MKTRVQSSRSEQALGIFCLVYRCFAKGFVPPPGRTLGLLVGGILLSLLGSIGPTHGDQSQQSMSTKRRQQGILTGMPFMANLAPRTFVDDLGRKIYLSQAPGRIVSLAPSVTETLYALEAGDRVVGVTPYCDYPPEAQSKPKVGYSHPNLEAILALKPDLVLAPSAFIRADLLEKLEQLKVPAFILEANTVEDIFSHIQTIGRMLNRTESAARVVTGMRTRIGQVTARIKDLPRQRVLYVLNMDPLITAGPGSFLHGLIELAGGINIASGASSPYPRFSMEAVVKGDPQVILFPVGEAEGIPENQRRQWERWSNLTAVRQGRLYTIDSDILNRPGPRIAQGLERLARTIHPNAFRPMGAS